MLTRVVLHALAPIAHGAFGLETGNAVGLRRLLVVGAPGMPRVPALSGNALRGTLRRILMRDLLHRAGLERTTPGWDRLYAALANGGHLVGAEAPAQGGEPLRALRASLPPLSVLGAALYSRMLPGHVHVGIAWPRCQETAAAGLVAPGDYPPAEDLVEEVGLCRHVDREHQDPEVSGVTPMPVTVEVLVTGTVLESELAFAAHAPAEEVGAIAHALDGLEWIGAKGGQGFGRVRVEHQLDPQPYADWLARTPDLRARLAALAAELAA